VRSPAQVIGSRRVECLVCTDIADQTGVFLCVNLANVSLTQDQSFLSTDMVTQQ